MANEPPSVPFDKQLRQSEFPRLSTRRELIRLDSIRSKLVAPLGATSFREGRPIRAPDWSVMQTVSDKTAADIKDIEDLMQLLPDTELSMQILVSSILSPKDMCTTEINYSVDGNRFTSELTAALLKPIRDHFDNEHKIIEVLPDWLRDALFRTGSYATAILPESTIDDAINSHRRVGLESIRGEFDPTTHTLHALNVLGNPNRQDAGRVADGDGAIRFALEDYYNHNSHSGGYTDTSTLNLSIVDNFNLLKLPILHDKVRKDKIQALYKKRNLAVESYDTNTDSSVYRTRQYQHTPVVTLRNAKSSGKKNFGHPMALHLPSESVIPVHAPGNPTQHLGYFVVLDENGNPISRADQVDFYRQMGSHLTNTAGSAQQNMSSEIRRLHQSYFGNSDTKTEELRELERMYIEIVEHELVSRLKAGVYGREVAISKDPELYRVMFARACQNKRAHLLYIPEDLMVYVAFDYDDYGVGQSLMSKSKITAGMRAMMLLAEGNGALRNAIGRIGINIVIDEKDTDPSKTVEFALHEFSKVNAGAFPLGIGNPQDIMNYLQRASIKVNVEGNSRYPGTKFDVDDIQGNKTVPEREFQESLKKQHIQSFGLPPEMVDNSQGPDFATTIVQNNLLMSKRIQTYQSTTNIFLTKYAQTYILNSETLMSELRTIVQDCWDRLEKQQKIKETEPSDDDLITRRTPDSGPLGEKSLTDKIQYFKSQLDEGGIPAILNDFVTALRLQLPAPDTAILENQKKSLEAYAATLDQVLDYYISENFVTSNSVGDKLSTYAKEIKDALKAYYMRRYIRENNILPELDELTTFSEEDGPAIDLLEVNKQHLEGIARSVLKYAEELAKVKKELQSRTDALDQTEGSSSSFDAGSGSSFGSSDNAGGDNASDDFGNLDMGGDSNDDVSGDSETTVVTETSKTTSSDSEVSPENETDAKDDDAPEDKEPSTTP